MKPGACASGPASSTIGDATQPMDEKNMPGNDVNDKSSSGTLNENRGQSHQDNGQHSQSSGYGGGAVSAHDDAVARNGGGDNGSQKTGTSQTVEHAPTIQRAGRAVAITNSVLALATIGTLIVTAFQLISMNGQLKQMKIANEFTKNAVEASIRQAKAAENANDISYKALLSDRAWVYVSNSLLKGNIVSDKELQVTFQFKNIGKSIARKFASDTYVNDYDAASGDLNANMEYIEKFSQECMKNNNISDGILVYPSYNQDAIQMNRTFDISIQKDDIISGRRNLIFLSCSRYESENQIKHVFACRTFSYTKSDASSLNYCKNGGNAD